MRMRKPKFIIKPADGVVVCILEDTAFDLVRDMNFPSTMPLEFMEIFVISDQYKGVARLHEGDTWDEEFGKKLAFEKAYMKYKAAKVKKLEKVKNVLVDTAAALKDIIVAIEKD